MPEGNEPELKRDNSEQQKALISHFVGNWLLKATSATEDGGSAQDVRDKLVVKLLGCEAQGPIVDKALELIRKSDWSTSQNLENFRDAYLAFEKEYGIRQ
jgi:hypothetical protein